MSRFPFVFLVVFLMGCNTKTTQNQTVDNTVYKDTTLLTAKDLKTLTYTDYVLDKATQNKLSGWMKYNALNTVVEEIKKADLSHFKNDKTIVETLAKELMQTIPEVIDTDAVSARVLVVQNMYLRLNNIVNLPTSSKQDIKKGILDFLQAFSNLKFQINKKFERDAQTIEKP